MFAFMEARYQVMVTNLHLNAENIRPLCQGSRHLQPAVIIRVD